MKRVLLLFMACMVFVSAVASAEIKKGKDSFTNDLSVSCSIIPEHFIDILYLNKIGVAENARYKVTISKESMKKYLISDFPIEIKIDEYPVCDLSNYKYQVTGPDKYGVDYNSIIEAEIPWEIVEKLNKATRVAIRFRDNNATKWPYILPDDVLAEWKEVINTEA